MKPYLFFDRQEFVAKRYARFLLKKQYIKDNGLESVAHLTDLDKVFKPYTVPMKDIIICDRCNENIEDPLVVSLEACFIYHQACIQDELPAQPEKPQPEPIDNLVFLDDYRNQGVMNNEN